MLQIKADGLKSYESGCRFKVTSEGLRVMCYSYELRDSSLRFRVKAYGLRLTGLGYELRLTGRARACVCACVRA